MEQSKNANCHKHFQQFRHGIILQQRDGTFLAKIHLNRFIFREILPFSTVHKIYAVSFGQCRSNSGDESLYTIYPARRPCNAAMVAQFDYLRNIGHTITQQALVQERFWQRVCTVFQQGFRHFMDNIDS